MEQVIQGSDFHRTHDILSQHFKQWAFTVSGAGDSVRVHHQSNVGLVKDILAKQGLAIVRVSYSAN
jgi:hypothetical protein